MNTQQEWNEKTAEITNRHGKGVGRFETGKNVRDIRKQTVFQQETSTVTRQEEDGKEEEKCGG